MKIFISYRRDDSIIATRLIHNELVARFGADGVFMDIDDIAFGDDFVRKINQHLDAADVVVAVIGPHWTEMLLQRCGTKDDYVRHELQRALERGIRIVPVLVDKAAPPGATVPDELAALRTLSAITLDARALKPYINALVETLQGRSFEEVVRELERRLRSLRRAQWSGAGIGLVVFCAAWVALFDFVGLDTRLASATMWLAQAGRSAPWSGEVVLVSIDDTTLQHVGRAFDASWRREHARVIDTLARAGARSIAFDLFIERPGDEAADAALETALRAAQPTPVVFGVQQMQDQRPLLLPRMAALATAGIACAGQKLGYARAMPLAVRRGALLFPSLALSAYSGGGKVEAFDGMAQQLRVRLVRDEQSPDVRFSALERVRAAHADCEAIHKDDEVALQFFDPGLLPALRSAPRRIAYEQLLDASDATQLAALKGKIVLVGLQLRERDVMTLARGGERWGVELVAEQIDALVRGAVIRPLGAWASLATMLVLAFAGAFASRAVAARAAWVRFATLLAASILCVTAAVLLYRSMQLLINLPYVLAAFLLAWCLMAWLERRGVR